MSVIGPRFAVMVGSDWIAVSNGTDVDVWASLSRVLPALRPDHRTFHSFTNPMAVLMSPYPIMLTQMNPTRSL